MRENYEQLRTRSYHSSHSQSFCNLIPTHLYKYGKYCQVMISKTMEVSLTTHCDVGEILVDNGYSWTVECEGNRPEVL